MDGTKFWNPYLAGIALGLVLLVAFAWLCAGQAPAVREPRMRPADVTPASR